MSKTVLTRRTDFAELKTLWEMLERLQADVKEGAWTWETNEREALVTVMDAVKDTYTCPPLKRA